MAGEWPSSWLTLGTTIWRPAAETLDIYASLDVLVTACSALIEIVAWYMCAFHYPHKKCPVSYWWHSLFLFFFCFLIVFINSPILLTFCIFFLIGHKIKVTNLISHYRTVPKSYRNIVYTDLEANLDTLIPHMYTHNRLLPWLGTGTSIKCGGVKLALWDQTS